MQYKCESALIRIVGSTEICESNDDTQEMRRKEFPGAQLHLFAVVIMVFLFLIVMMWMNKLSIRDFLRLLTG
jgi:hypothetical protein